MKIVVLDGYALNPGDLSWDALSAFGELQVYDRTAPEDVVERMAGAEVAVTNKVVFDASTLNQLPMLKCIVVTATGYNIIDTKAAAERGIVVCNAPAYSTASVAQHVFALLLNIANSIEHYATANRGGAWAESRDFCYIDKPTIELCGKTMGIVGMGNIGGAVAQIANAFGMRVVAMTSKDGAQLPAYVQKVTFDELLSQSDVLSLHCPLTADTREIIDAASISKMKRGAILINTSRGPLVNEQAVVAGLDDGQLAAYGADVLGVEPAQKGNALVAHPRAFTTPHIAWATVEARQRLMEITIQNVTAFCQGAAVNVVN